MPAPTRRSPWRLQHVNLLCWMWQYACDHLDVDAAGDGAGEATACVQWLQLKRLQNTQL
jgi:hypothetical protein